MSDKFTIRKAIPADLPVLLRFEQELINAERPLDETMINEEFHYYDLAAMIESTEAEVLVAEADGKLVGSCHCSIRKGDPWNTFDRYAFLGFMYVSPEYRGLGITQVIMRRLKDWAAARGLTEVRLQVYDDNIAAVKAYEKIGFKKILTEMRLGITLPES